MRKLQRFSGKSVLALLDLSGQTSLGRQDIESYRNFSLGKGNHRKFPVNIIHAYRQNGQAKADRYTIRI